MEKRTTRFLNISLIVVSCFCVLVFAIQTVFINLMGESAIRRLGVFYMSGISEQVSSHFGTTIELRLSQVEALVNSMPPGRVTDRSAMQVSLTYNARSAGFEYLALYTDDGNFQMIYGSQVTADVPEALRRSVQGGKYNVCAGKDRTGTPVVLVGVPANYPMDDGSVSMALVAGLPTSYLSDTLENNIQTSLMEYSIIRDDGSYVLHNDGIGETNYFDRVEKYYETCDRKEPSQYAAELRDAMEADIDYTSEAVISGERWNVYCTNLPNSEWHLLIKISHNTLDETINLLRKQWSFLAIGGGSLIICALLLVFVGYYRLSKMQMHALDDARKTAERAQLSAERSNRVKDEFLSNMSHDIRTPMNGIMGMTSIAINSLDNPSRVRSCLKRIHVSSRHLLGLINDMLDMSKIGNGELTLSIEPISLREVMQNLEIIIQPQIQEKKQRFHIYVHDIYHENVCSDRVRLTQILLNVLGNAVKFTPEGGEITADLYEEASPKGAGYIRSHLHVRDNGIGISEEFQKKIFDAFAREDSARKAAGAGMGLTITKHIVDAMGGTITVESKQGQGSHFHITLDMEKAAHQEKELHLPERNVLVIDEDETEGRLITEALRSINLYAEPVADPESAVRRIEERRAKQKPYHMALLNQDIRGWDIFQTAKELSERFGGELPLILLTDSGWDEVETKSEEAGIGGLIAKPLFRSGLYYGLRPFAEAAPGQQQEAKLQEAVPMPDRDLTGIRILLAEDNELNAEIAAELLEGFGLTVDLAENGQVCVERLAASEDGWYQAILMDLRMPVMTGFEAAEAIRKMERKDAQSMPIIAVSADAFEDDIEKCLACGMNAHTAKPLNIETVFALLRQYLP
ncbi:MAG: response regulator [Bacteroidales bacterium]|nr:response regulator [Bacteroidales bacterium]MCM1415068.1 response regulator [bacterium]MCM1424267.1 response regulator [bacterium]